MFEVAEVGRRSKARDEEGTLMVVDGLVLEVKTYAVSLNAQQSPFHIGNAASLVGVM